MSDYEQMSEQEIICPYCKTAREPSGEYNDLQEETCEECGKNFVLYTETITSWTAVKDCDLNEEPHKWVAECLPRDDGSLSYDCSKCGASKNELDTGETK